MNFGKRELVLSALVVAMGTAVYLNWQFDSNKDKLSATEENDDLGVAHYVNAAIATSDNASSKTVSSKANVSSESLSPQDNSYSSVPTNAEDYFAKVRLERKQIQDDLIELAKEVIESTDQNGKGRKEAVEHLNKMSDIIQQQTNVENLIIAKGFDDCVAFIQNEECSIVVTGQELKSDTLIAIKDIVIGQTGITFDKIRVTHL